MSFMSLQEENGQELRKGSESGNTVPTGSNTSFMSSSRPSAGTVDIEKRPLFNSGGNGSANNGNGSSTQTDGTSEGIEQSFNRMHEATLRRKEQADRVASRLQELGQKMMLLKETDLVGMYSTTSNDQKE